MDDIHGASVPDQALPPSAPEPLQVSALSGNDPSRVSYAPPLDEVRELLLAEARKFEPQAWRGPGVGKWCKANHIQRSHVSEFFNGKRLPTTDILNALGLEWRICRKEYAPASAIEARQGGSDG